MEAFLFKSIEYYNQQLEELGSPLRFKVDKQHFNMRIAKKKNGKPNTDYPSKVLIDLCVYNIRGGPDTADI